jgi:hypothetical protein
MMPPLTTLEKLHESKSMHRELKELVLKFFSLRSMNSGKGLGHRTSHDGHGLEVSGVSSLLDKRGQRCLLFLAVRLKHGSRYTNR